MNPVVSALVALSVLAGIASPVLNGGPAAITIPAPATVPFEGGPRETLAAQCMADWDAGTHMSKAEWSRACQRTQDGTRF